jgi:hypothetical protein
VIYLKKGFLVLITVIIILVLQCGVALGDSVLGDASLYLEGSVSTQNDIHSTPEANNNWGSGVLGIEASVGRCKVTVESFDKTMEGNDIQSTNTVVGFEMINADFIRLDATLSNHNLEINDSADSVDTVHCNGYLIGLDLHLDLSERTFLETAIGYTNAGTWETSATHSNASILTYQLKYDWMPWQNFGFSVGYRYYSYHPNSVAETNFNAMYCGLVWRFNNIDLKTGDGAPVQVWGK